MLDAVSTIIVFVCARGAQCLRAALNVQMSKKVQAVPLFVCVCTLGEHWR